MEAPQPRQDRFDAVVRSIEPLNAETVAVQLACPDIGYYQAGQYLKVFIDGHTTRYYSLASAPGIDDDLLLHVRRKLEGSSGRWFHEVLQVGDTVAISAPRGVCGYQPGQPEQPLLMVSTGSGLAPYYGIVRTALQYGHRASMHLYHGVRFSKELYLVEQLQALARRYPNFHYVPCVSGEVSAEGFRAGRALDIALREVTLSSVWQVYLCGHPDMVENGWKRLIQAGVLPHAILSDQVPDIVARLATMAA
jgi:ferredoxin-NADP reductase